MIITFNNKIIAPAEGKWLEKGMPPIPQYSIRIKYTEGFTPSGNVVCVDPANNIWDKYGGTNWQYIASDSQLDEDHILEIVGANSTGVINMANAFQNCGLITSMPLFDTSTVEGWSQAFQRSLMSTLPLYDTHNIQRWGDTFYYCIGLTEIPDFDVSSATKFTGTFQNCWSVRSGILRMYNKLVALGEQVQHNQYTFDQCGKNYNGVYASEQARLERAQIPTTWGGDMQV